MQVDGRLSSNAVIALVVTATAQFCYLLRLNRCKITSIETTLTHSHHEIDINR